jgi:hypothetical protein
MLKRLLGLFWSKDSDIAPLIAYNFPNIGPNGEITMNCVIHPSGRPHLAHSGSEQDGYAGVVGVPSHCVAAVFIEADQYGLRFHWKPFKLDENSVPSPFSIPPSGKSPEDPTKNRDK